MKKNLIVRFQLYNKGMESIDWNDVNVLRKLPDGWYSAPSDSEYGKKIRKDPDIKLNDSVEKASKRHGETQKKEREVTRFIRSARLKYKFDTCVHKNYSYKGHQICAVCGLTKRDPTQFVPEEGYESRVCVSEKGDNDIMNKSCIKAITILRRLIDDLDIDQDIVLDDILDVFKTYVLTSEDRGRRIFRISAMPRGLCAALLWRDLQIKKVSMTMLEFSRRIKVDRVNILTVFQRLDDYKDLHVSKRGRPFGSKKKI